MIDYVIVSAYIFVIFSIAFYYRRDYSSIDLRSFYLADRSIGLRESIFSIIATEVSALTFIGIPAFSFGSNFNFIWIYVGAIIGRLIIAYSILPRIYNKGTTLYEIIIKMKNSSPNAQAALSGIYIVGRILGIGVRLYAGSILVSEFFKVSIETAIFITSFITFCYTLVGGLKVVVKTDFIQVCVFIIGGIAAHFIITDLSTASWSEMIGNAYQSNKIFDFQNLYQEILIGFLGGILFDICTHGMDQDFVQRLLACKDLKTSQKAITFSSILSISVGLLFLSIGALLWNFFQVNTYPADLGNDKVFAYFITNYFPSGLKGLMLAGVLAATMSTLDSTINAVGSCLNVDIFKRQVTSFKTVFWDSFIILILLLLVALAAKNSSGILTLGLTIASWIGAGILLIYLTQVLPKFKKLSFLTVLFIFLLNVALVAVNTFIIKGAWQFNVYLSAGVGLVLLKVFYPKE